MGDIINIAAENTLNKKEIFNEQTQFVELTDQILLQTRSEIEQPTTMKLPIIELSELGTTVASLIPNLTKVVQGNNGEKAYRIVNKTAGDTLKKAKNGNYWGALRKADGGSKFVQLQEISELANEGLMIQPQVIIVAALLYSVEKRLDNIVELEKQILSFLETEKESSIEADAETLMDLIRKYKHNWDNSHFVSSSHKMVMDIQRSARQQMTSYQKKLEEDLKSNPLLIIQSEVSSAKKKISKKFKYYSLSLYTYSLASYIEIMLSGNLAEKNILSIKEEIEKLSSVYSAMFTKCLNYLEKMSESSIESNVLKGVGEASKAIGSFLGNIPFIKDSPVDEFLQDGGEELNKSAKKMEKDIIKSFKKLENAKTSVFIDRLNELNQIYNHTSDVCIDNENIYFIVS